MLIKTRKAKNSTRGLYLHLKKVGLHHTANQLDGILEDASKHNVSYSDFLSGGLKTFSPTPFSCLVQWPVHM
jgi:hypothetical protein